MANIPDDNDGGGMLMPILVSLLVVVGLGTAGLFGYIGYISMNPQPASVSTGDTSQMRVQTPTQPMQHQAENAVVSSSSDTGRSEPELQQEQTSSGGTETSSSGTAQNNPPAVTPDPSTAKPQTGVTSGGGGGTWGEDSTTDEITGNLTKTAYWVSSGKSYHFAQNCPSLSRSTNIKSGTLQDALNDGKTDPCNNCAGGS